MHIYVNIPTCKIHAYTHKIDEYMYIYMQTEGCIYIYIYSTQCVYTVFWDLMSYQHSNSTFRVVDHGLAGLNKFDKKSDHPEGPKHPNTGFYITLRLKKPKSPIECGLWAHNPQNVSPQSLRVKNRKYDFGKIPCVWIGGHLRPV